MTTVLAQCHLMPEAFRPVCMNAGLCNTPPPLQRSSQHASPLCMLYFTSASAATVQGSQEQGLSFVQCHSPVFHSALHLCVFARAPMAKCYTLGDLDNRNVFSPGRRKLEVYSQGVAGLVFSGLS